MPLPGMLCWRCRCITRLRRDAELQWVPCAGEDPVRLVGMLIPEKALPDLMAELQSTARGGPAGEEIADPDPVSRVQEGPVKGSLRDIR
jgi:hypothetical protein